jgi:hypothetical protein
MGWMTQKSGFDSKQVQKISLFSYRVQTTSGGHSAYYLTVLRDLSPGLKWQGHEADYSPSSSAKVKNA